MNIDKTLISKCNTLVEECLKHDKHTCCLVQFLGSIVEVLESAKYKNIDINEELQGKYEFFDEARVVSIDTRDVRGYLNMLISGTSKIIVDDTLLYELIDKKFKKRILNQMYREGITNFNRIKYKVNRVNLEDLDSKLEFNVMKLYKELIVLVDKKIKAVSRTKKKDYSKLFEDRYLIQVICLDAKRFQESRLVLERVINRIGGSK